MRNLRMTLLPLLAAMLLVGIAVGGCERGQSPTGVSAPAPLSLESQRQKVSPQAHYVATAVCPDGFVDVYQYAGTNRMRWIVWQRPDTALSLDVWPQGDSLAGDCQFSMFFDASWWKCVGKACASCSDRCTNSYPNDPDCYSKCMSAGIAGCTIGRAIVYALTWFLPDK